MGATVSAMSKFVLREQHTRTLLLLYADSSGEVQRMFDKRKVSPDKRLSWLQRWRSMDSDGSNTLDYQNFVKACGLADNLWSQRAFSLLNRNLKGSIDFCTFFRLLPRLLVFDRANTIEMAFRMCSRRGVACCLNKLILDEKDLGYIVEQRYPNLGRRRVSHRALAILEHLDEDGSAGINFQTFQLICNSNPVLLTAVHSTMQALRQAIFGDQFWKIFTIEAKTFEEDTRKQIFCDLQTSVNTPTYGTPKRAVDPAGQCKFYKTSPNSPPAPFVRERVLGKETRFSPAKSSAHIQRLRILVRATSVKARKTFSEGAAATTFKRAVLKSQLDTTRYLRGMDCPGRLKERFWNTHSGIRTLTAEDVREGLRNAGKCALEHLEVHARSISHQVFKAGVTVREPSMRGRSRIPELRRMAARTRKLGEVVIDKLKFLNPNKRARGISASTAATARDLNVHTTPRRLLEVGAVFMIGRRVAEVAELGGARAFEALRRSAQVTYIARRSTNVPETHTSHEGHIVIKDWRREAAENQNESSSSGDHIIDKVGSDDNGGAGKQEIWKTVDHTGSERSDAVDARDSAWTMTMNFYEQLTIAATRLEAKRSAKKGYDFAADFPALCNATHRSNGKPSKGTRRQETERADEARKRAIVCMRVISSRQESPVGRSRLLAAFNQWWRLTCSATAQPSSYVEPVQDEEMLSCSRAREPSSDPAMRRKQLQSMVDMLMTTSGAATQISLHDLVLAKEQNDRPLPSELCDVYAQEMIEMINRRQAQNNVPLILPF